MATPHEVRLPLPVPRDAWLSRGWWIGCAWVGLLVGVTEQAVYATGLTVGPGIYVVWPVNGVALALLVLLGWRCWPGMLIGGIVTALLVPAFVQDPTPWSLTNLFGELSIDVLQVAATAWAVQRIAGRRSFLGTLRQALALLAVAGLAGPLLNTTASIAWIWSTGLIQSREVLGSALIWLASEALGVLIVAPTLILWSRPAARQSLRQHPAAWAVGLAALAIACALGFSPLEHHAAQTLRLPDTAVHLAAFTLLLPAFAWLVVQFAQLGATLALAVFGLAATVGTSFQYGILRKTFNAPADPIDDTWISPLTQAVIQLQIILAVVAATALLASALVAERATQREQLLQQAQRLRKLGQRALEAERRERTNLAARLHDGLIQSLAVARLALAHQTPDNPTPSDSPQYQPQPRAQRALDDAEHQARALLQDLDPPALHLLGLHGALAGLVRKFETNHDLPILYDAQPPDQKPQPEIEAFLLRAAQELLTNVVKHGGDRASLEYQANEKNIRLQVWDDGPGFDLHAHLHPHLHPHLDANPNPNLDDLLDDLHYGLHSLHEQLQALGGQLRANPNRKNALEITIPA